MVRGFEAKAHTTRSRKRPICVLLVILCALTWCAIGVSFTSAHATETVVSGQTVDANGFRLTYEQQGVDRRHKDGETAKYDDTSPELYSKITTTAADKAVGVDNWGKPIDFSRRFRIQTYVVAANEEDTAHMREWMVFDIASTTDAATVNAVQGWNTMPVNNPAYGQEINPDSIVHFTSNHNNAWAWVASQNNVMWSAQSKGFATDNEDGSLHVGAVGFSAAKPRVYFYTFDFVSGDDAAERSTLTASASVMYAGEVEEDVFYLTDTQKTLAGKKGYFSLNFNGKANDYYIKLVHENTLTVNTAAGYGVSEMQVGENSHLPDADGKFTEDYSVTPAETQKVWGGDLVKMKLTGDDPMIKIGDMAVLQGADGYWSFYMPDDDTEIEILQKGTYYAVNFDTDGGSTVLGQAVLENETITVPTAPTKAGYDFVGWFADEDRTVPYDFETPVTEAITLYAKWAKLHTVTYKINGFEDKFAYVRDGAFASAKNLSDDFCPAVGDRVLGWQVDNLSLVWYKDAGFETEFAFATDAITQDTTVYGKLTEVKQYKNTNAYGWDELKKFTDDSNTQYVDGDLYASAFSTDPDGTATFMMTREQEAIYSRALDVTEDIYMDLSLTVGATGDWFMIGFWDNLTLAQIAYSNNYQHTYGVQGCFGLNSASGAVYTGDSSGHDGDLSDAVDGKKVRLKITIGETLSVIYKYKTVGEGDEAVEQWVKYADFAVKQTDFGGGKAYVSLATFTSTQAEVKLWQEIDAQAVTTENDGHGTVTATVIGGGSTLKIETQANEGYELDTLTVNGEAVTLSRQGFYAFGSYTDIAEGVTVKATFKFIGSDDTTGDDGNGNPGGDENTNNGGKKKKCGGTAGGFGAGSVAAVVLAGTGALLLIRRKRANG